MPAATVYSGNKAGWLTNVAVVIQDGGVKPPSRADLLARVPEKVGTHRNDGHVTAHENGFDRQDYRKGYEIWIDGCVEALRAAGLVGGDNGTLTWIGDEDGHWKVPFAGNSVSVYGKAERVASREQGDLGLLLRGMSDVTLNVRTKSHGREFVKEHTFGVHPLALVIPPMTEEEQARLRADIEANGVDVPIVLFADETDRTARGKPIEKILDGRHRGFFASVTGRPVTVERFEGTVEQARDKVFRLNLLRRHLTPQQIAKSIVLLYGEQAKEEAKADMEWASTKGTPPGDLREGSSGKHDREWPARAVKMAGSPPGVTPDTVRAVAPALEPGNEDIAEAIDSGEIKSTAEVTSRVKKKRGGTGQRGKGTVGQNISAPRSAMRRMGEALGQLKVVRQEWDSADEQVKRINRTPEQWAELLARADEIVEHAVWLRREIAKGAGPGLTPPARPVG